MLKHPAHSHAELKRAVVRQALDVIMPVLVEKRFRPDGSSADGSSGAHTRLLSSYSRPILSHCQQVFVLCEYVGRASHVCRVEGCLGALRQERHRRGGAGRTDPTRARAAAQAGPLPIQQQEHVHPCHLPDHYQVRHIYTYIPFYQTHTQTNIYKHKHTHSHACRRTQCHICKLRQACFWTDIQG